MKLKNKIFLSLGTTASVIAPIATTVACGDTKEVSATAIEQRELWAKSQNAIETHYQEMLISTISKSSDIFSKDIDIADFGKYEDIIKHDQIKNAIVSFVKRNIYANSSYLSKFAEKLLHTVNENSANKKDFYQHADLVTAGFYDYFLPNTDVTTNTKIDALITNFMPVIWNENIANFKNVFYQYMISMYFLDTSKSNWRAVFTDAVGATGKINGLEGNLKDESFVLGQKLLRAKLAYDWEVTLDDSASKAYAAVAKTEDELDTALETGDIYKDATTTLQRSKLPAFDWDSASASKDTVWKIVDSNKNLIGYKGLVEKAAFASYDSKMKQVVDIDKYDVIYEGYINKETSEIVNNKDVNNQSLATAKEPKIKITTPSNSKVDIEKIVMLMPLWINGEMSMDLLKDSDAVANGAKGNGFTTIKNILISKQGADIYKEAIQYYSSKDNKEFNWDDTKKIGGIRLTILDDSLRKVALDTFGLDYVEKDE